MPGSEVADTVHNFFEQENTSQGGQNQAQISNANWSHVNNNPWVQRQNDVPVSSASKNYTLQASAGSERGSDWQTSQFSFGADLTQLGLRPEVVKNQPQRLPSLNGYVLNTPGFQDRAGQLDFLRENTIHNLQNSKEKGVSFSELQGNAPEQGFSPAKATERAGNIESPVSIDFFGGRQPLMRNQQQPGVPQPQLRQPSGVNDMQLWQQHIMYKQFQDIQRQQQLQQIDQEARQQNSLNQLIAKQASADQLSVFSNGTANNRDSNYGWQSELMGGESKVANASQVHIGTGEANWVQHSAGMPTLHSFPNGFVFSQEQGQSLRSVGFVPQQQMDHSPYGAPVAVARGGALNQYNHIQGLQVTAETMNRVAGNQGDRPLQTSTFNTFQNDQPPSFSDAVCGQDGTSASKQGFQGKNLFGQISLQSYNNNVTENFQQANSFSKNLLAADLHGRQNHVDWAGPTQEKSSAQVGSSQGTVSLDPTEAKILFGTDDGNWDGSFGRSIGGLQGSQLGGADFLNAFPSIQSGSWSALMQSAVAETSSGDIGAQEEWSGLSFQKTEVSTVNNPSLLDNNMQNPSLLSSKTFPLFDESKANASGFQQPSAKFPFVQDERLRIDALQETFQQLPKESKWVDEGLPQKSEGGLQTDTPMHLQNASEGTWMGHMYDRSNMVVQSVDMRVNMQNVQGPWSHQQNTHSYDTASSKANAWNVSETLPACADGQNNDHNRTIYIERGHGTNMWKSNDNTSNVTYPNTTGGLEQVRSGRPSPQMHSENSFVSNFSASPNSVGQELKQQFLNSRSDDYNKHVLADSSENYRAQENLSRYQQQTSRSPQESSMNNSDQASGETYEKKKEMSGDSYMSSRSQSGQHAVTGSSQRENTWLNANDPRAVGNSQKSSGQVSKKTATRKFQYHPMGNLGVEAGDSLRRAVHSSVLSQPLTRGKGQDQGLLGPSFTSHIAPNTGVDREKGNASNLQSSAKGAEELASRNGQPGQHMLELLHKVDQSREKSTSGHYISSDQNQSSVTAPLSSDSPASHLNNNHTTASQGYGLRLAPPSQRVLVANSQNLGSLISRQSDLEVGYKRPSLPNSQEVPSSHEMPQGDYNSGIIQNASSQAGPQASYSDSRMTSGHPYPMNQVPQQQMESGKGQLLKDQSDFTQQNELASFPGQNARAHNLALRNLAVQESLRGRVGRIPLFSLPPNSSNTNSSFLRGADQTEDTRSAQGGPFSKMLHNVWTSVPAQQHGGLTHRVPPNSVQSMHTPGRSLEATPWVSQHPDGQNTIRSGNGPSEFGKCAVNSQQFSYSEEQKIGKDGSLRPERPDLPSQGSAVPLQHEASLVSSLAGWLHQPESSQAENVSVTSNNATESGGQSLRPLNLAHQSYSLLQQVQAMKDLDDPSRSAKRLKGVESNFDAQQMIANTNQRFLYGFGRSSVDSEGSSAGKMLSFSSEGKEDKSLSHSSQNQSEDASMQYSSNPNLVSSTSVRGAEHVPKINPQMPPSWFEQYGAYKNGQILAMYDGLDSSRRAAKSAAHQFFFGKSADKIQATPQTPSTEQAKVPSNMLADNDQLPTPQSLSPVVMGDSLAIVRPKKRKSATSELLPWHKEIAQDILRLQTVSEAELDWAQASNRRIEKLEDESEMIDDGSLIPRPRRRLILTTQLMQQLLRALPAAIFSAKAMSEYESLTFYAARLALGDACGFLSCSGSDLHVHGANENTTSEKPKASGNQGDPFYLKVVEDFMTRAKKLENDLLRLDKGSSLLDLRVECQELEKFAIINRFARFHGRGSADGVEGSTSSDAMARKSYPQRYVTAYSMPRNLPEGVLCLSL